VVAIGMAVGTAVGIVLQLALVLHSFNVELHDGGDATVLQEDPTHTLQGSARAAFPLLS